MQILVVMAQENFVLMFLALISVLFGVVAGFAHHLEVCGIAKGLPRDSQSLAAFTLGVIVVFSGVHAGVKTGILTDTVILTAYFLYLFWVVKESISLLCRATLRL